MKLTVSRIEQIAQAVKVFGLRDTAGSTLPAFDSGAQEVSDIPLQRLDQETPQADDAQLGEHRDKPECCRDARALRERK